MMKLHVGKRAFPRHFANAIGRADGLGGAEVIALMPQFGPQVFDRDETGLLPNGKPKTLHNTTSPTRPCGARSQHVFDYLGDHICVVAAVDMQFAARLPKFGGLPNERGQRGALRLPFLALSVCLRLNSLIVLLAPP